MKKVSHDISSNKNLSSDPELANQVLTAVRSVIESDSEEENTF